MKKAIIIFSLGLFLIIGGGLITLTELSAWNSNEQTFEDEGYATKSKSINVNIDKYEESSISEHITFEDLSGYSLYSGFTELKTKYKVDNNQPKGILKYELIYYPRFGECDLRADEFNVKNNRIYFDNSHHRPHGQRTNKFVANNSETYLDLSSDCYQGYFNRNFFRNHLVDLQDFRTIMRLKKFPFNIQQVIITINPSDEYKLLK